MSKSDPNLLTQAEYAQSRKDRGLPGGSRVAVHKAVKENRISAFGPEKLIDQELADSQWARNTRARVGSVVTAGHVSESEPDLLSAPVREPDGVSPDRPPVVEAYTEWKTKDARADWELKQHRLAVLRGEVRDVSDINRGGFDIARELRDAMDSSVNTLAAELAPLDSADACAQVLRRHNRTIQEMLAKGLREKLSVKVAAE